MSVTDGKVVLVTGGAGFIGAHTVGHLIRQGFTVVAIDDFSTGRRESLDRLSKTGPLDIVELDIRDATKTRHAVSAAQPWAIIHLAAIHFIPYCVAHPAETLAINTVGFQNVVDAAAEADVQRILFTSTGDVYQSSDLPHAESDPTVPSNVYGASKLMGEWLLRFRDVNGANVAFMVARLFNTYGPGETNPHLIPDIINMVNKGDDLLLGNLSPRRDYIYVDDVARTLVELVQLEDMGGVVNLGTGIAWNVKEVVDVIADILHRPLSIKTNPQKLRPSDRPNLQADVSRLRSLLPAFAPRSLAEGLGQLLCAEGLVGQGE